MIDTINKYAIKSKPNTIVLKQITIKFHCFEDVTNVADQMDVYDIIDIDLSELDEYDSQRILDFLIGAAMFTDSSIKRLTANTYRIQKMTNNL